MHGPTLATLVVLASIGLTRPSTAGTSDAVEEARRRLARNDGASAITVLEKALAEAGPDRDVLLGTLRTAYEMAASQAQAAGRTREADSYREDLKILNRKIRPVSTSSPEPPAPTPSPGPSPLPDGPAPTVEPVPEPPAPTPSLEPKPPVLDEPTPSLPRLEAPAEDLASGDSAFSARNYREAGRIYSGLARANRLPANRMECWAYCRASSVVARINAHPRTEADWAAIDAEIVQIRDQLRAANSTSWLGEYLRNLAADRPGGRKNAKPGKTVVRASSPEEPAPTVDRPVRTASLPSAAEPAASGVGRTASPPATGATTAPRWQIRDTANFRIFHADPALAEKVAQVAEASRHQQLKQWSNVVGRKSWQPQCELYLYPNAKLYARMTGQPEDSPGFSTMGMNGGKIISRRINLRVDHPTLLPAVLPHEITHVILADIFPTQQIPRWADEGLAVLAEPADEQQRRAADLVTPLASNRLFPLDALMSMDYPDNQYWALYYAQSVSLTRFLVEQGTPAQMIQFLQGAQRNGFEPELRRVYQIDGYADLQRKWLAYAKSLEPARTAENPAPAEVGPDLKVR